MLKLLLVREIKNDKQTHGRFVCRQRQWREFICYSLEDERLVKGKSQTTIPTGLNILLLLNHVATIQKRITVDFKCT